MTTLDEAVMFDTALTNARADQVGPMRQAIRALDTKALAKVADAVNGLELHVAVEHLGALRSQLSDAEQRQAALTQQVATARGPVGPALAKLEAARRERLEYTTRHASGDGKSSSEHLEQLAKMDRKLNELQDAHRAAVRKADQDSPDDELRGVIEQASWLREAIDQATARVMRLVGLAPRSPSSPGSPGEKYVRL